MSNIDFFIILMVIGDLAMAGILAAFMYPDMSVSFRRWPPVRLGRPRQSTWAMVQAGVL
jgi:hypothetical protein